MARSAVFVLMCDAVRPWAEPLPDIRQTKPGDPHTTDVSQASTAASDLRPLPAAVGGASVGAVPSLETAMPRQPALLAIALSAALAACAGTTPAPSTPAAAAPSAASASERARQLDALYADYWQALLQRNPLLATRLGDHRFNDQWPDTYSAQWRQATGEFNRHWLQRALDIGNDGLQGQDLLSWQMFVRDRRQAIAGERFGDWMLPLNQMSSLPAMVVQLGSGQSAQPFATVRDYDNWLARGARVPALIDGIIGNLRAGMAAGVVQPRVLMEKVIPQLDALIVPRAEDSQLWGPIRQMPEDFDAAQRQRLEAAYRQMIEAQVLPTFARLRQFIASQYLPASRDSVGLDALPDGAAWYAHNVRQRTSTDLTPAQIHQIGLDEVQRIHGEVHKVMQQVGFDGSLQEFFAFMRNDLRFQYASEQAMLDNFRRLEGKVEARVAEQFAIRPKAAFEVRLVEPYRARSAAGGSYQGPSEDGSRPGIFYANAYDLPSRRKWAAESLFLHEAIPGHHFQIALKQELTELPAFRRFGGETVFSEGWALYAESLGPDLGFSTDPYDRFGYLQAELFRAIRLVVDTGLHSKGWSREQVIDYIQANSAEGPTRATSETERYIAWPGQALAYKIGELKIRQLRQRAEAELGPRFDVRAFHTEVLKDGSVPLDVLEEKIERWIAARRA